MLILNHKLPTSFKLGRNFKMAVFIRNFFNRIAELKD